MTPFGEKIRSLRKARGINQKKMAADLGVSPAYLSALEHGHRGQPSWAMVQKVIHYFYLIWDDAEEIETLARLSDTRTTINTAGLPPETVAFVNTLAAKVDQLSPQRVAELIGLLDRDKD
ncbi:helix-turn-helix domain-containing protein [Paremcibacter congregatus]|uniref:helix-turn-helix domain-containing protein n=1 Tax=Paremcibacter congregatus TaxID=2043170 RepID=UPI0030EE4282|tara:strand:- start:2108 stop:2467 length:360 start_codon:yes stop_codon:yes gene_type:complete